MPPTRALVSVSCPTPVEIIAHKQVEKETAKHFRIVVEYLMMAAVTKPPRACSAITPTTIAS